MWCGFGVEVCVCGFAVQLGSYRFFADVQCRQLNLTDVLCINVCCYLEITFVLQASVDAVLKCPVYMHVRML